MLGDGLAFESDVAMREHKAARGRTQPMAAPLEAREGARWRAERGDFSCAGQTASKCAVRARLRMRARRYRHICV